MSKDGYNVSFNRAVNEMKSLYKDHCLKTSFRDSLVRMYKEKHLAPDGRAIRYEYFLTRVMKELLEDLSESDEPRRIITSPSKLDTDK